MKTLKEEYYNSDYVRLYEIPVDEENIHGYILGFGCGSNTDLKKRSIQYVLDNCVGRPDSIIYDKSEFDEIFKLAKETLEKDNNVIIGV